MTGPYGEGPIDCEAALTVDFDVDVTIPIVGVVSQMDSDRRVMAARPGIVMKYAPLRFDPATGAHQIGGRYLFEGVEAMRDYVRFTSEELEFEAGVKFWERPFFGNVDRRCWRVVGAHNFLSVERHLATRLERHALAYHVSERDLHAVWPRLRDEASAAGLAAAWLLFDDASRELAILTAADGARASEDSGGASAALASLERMPSMTRRLGGLVGRAPRADRTSLNLSIWLPLASGADGGGRVFPSYPVHPLPIGLASAAALGVS